MLDLLGFYVRLAQSFLVDTLEEKTIKEILEITQGSLLIIYKNNHPILKILNLNTVLFKILILIYLIMLYIVTHLIVTLLNIRPILFHMKNIMIGVGIWLKITLYCVVNIGCQMILNVYGQMKQKLILIAIENQMTIKTIE